MGKLTVGFNMEEHKVMVVGEGFEPSKSMTADLQSAPFGHSGTPPGANQIVVALTPLHCVNSERRGGKDYSSLRSPFPADILTNLTCQFAVSLQRMMVVGEGFEPSKSMTADLQSAPFGHSGTPPLACFRLGKRGASYQMKRPCKGMNNGK
jgi:hypothetical protein